MYSCRYADSICLKFYEHANGFKENTKIKDKDLAVKPESINLESHDYDICNCINVTFTPRQIMSSGNFIQVRFKTVQRLYDSSMTSIHSKKAYRGYLIRYRFTRGNL